jgi:dTDP-4-amino-4,6-dideoxygalactose transaminase
MLMTRILLSSPDVGDLEQAYVMRALESGWVAPAGPDLVAFEEEMSARLGVAHAVALSSGTAALHLALVSWGVGPGDVVPMSTLTFAATANAVRYVGAEPHFVDCDPVTGNISLDLLRAALKSLREAGVRVPAVIPVDMLGKCADYSAIAALAAEFSVRVLSDAAESLGASRLGVPAGQFGDAAVLSFNGNKIMTTSGGGMLVTADEELAAHVRKLSTQAREPVAHYEHTEVGYNYRLSNILAALGRAQLSRLDSMLKKRREWRERYRALFVGCPGVSILGGDDDAEDNCWLTAVTVDPDVSAWTVDVLADVMARADLETRPVWKPMHLQPVFRDHPATLDGSSEQLFHEGLTLPSGSGMSDADFGRVESAIRGLVAA